MGRQYPINITKYKHKTVCDINRCDERSFASVGAEGMPAQFNHLYCSTHMKQIVIEGLKFYAEETEFIDKAKETLGTPTSDLESKDTFVDINIVLAENEALKSDIEATREQAQEEKEKLISKIASMDVTIESLESKLKKSESALAAAKKVGGRR
jgi:hypothetical protein